MSQSLLFLSAICLTVLALEVVYLVATNYSLRVLQPTVIIVGSAIVTLLVTLAVTLKEASWREAFFTTLVIDQSGRPVFTFPTAKQFRLGMRLGEVHGLAVQALAGKWAAPLDPEDAALLQQQIVQVQVIKALTEHYAGGWTTTFRYPTVLGGIAPQPVPQPIRTAAGTDVIASDVLWAKVEARNAVAKADVMKLGRLGLAVPAGTKVTVQELRPRVGLAVQPMIGLDLQNFFSIRMLIARSLEQAPAPAPREMIHVSDAEFAKLRGQSFLVRVDATFFRWRAGHPYTDAFQEWARGLVDVMRHAIGDQ